MHSRFVHPALLAALFAAAPFAAAMTPSDLSARLARNERLLVVDARPANAYTEGHIPGAINIPASLLPHKQLPAGPLVVVYGDGLGVIDDAQILAAAKAKPGVQADTLEGGYAAWLAETRLSTSAAGVTRERMPGITYDQLVKSAKGDVLLVDLRATSAAASTKAAANSSTIEGKQRASSATKNSDLVADFARKIGVPVVAPASASAAGARTLAAAGPNGPARAAAAVQGLEKSDKLLVLVAENEAEANEAARQLRARGHYRFTILIGGTEAIRHEGKTGSGRMDGGTSSPRQQ